jgi:hypothetical protein
VYTRGGHSHTRTTQAKDSGEEENDFTMCEWLMNGRRSRRMYQCSVLSCAKSAFQTYDYLGGRKNVKYRYSCPSGGQTDRPEPI